MIFSSEELIACYCDCCELLMQLYDFILFFCIYSAIFAV